MDQQDEEKMLNFFTKAFQEVVMPVLQEQSKQLNDLKDAISSLSKDGESTSLKMSENVNNQNISNQIQDHEKRISMIEADHI